jgi:hypothetical protein
MLSEQFPPGAALYGSLLTLGYDHAGDDSVIDNTSTDELPCQILTGSFRAK